MLEHTSDTMAQDTHATRFSDDVSIAEVVRLLRRVDCRPALAGATEHHNGVVSPMDKPCPD